MSPNEFMHVVVLPVAVVAFALVGIAMIGTQVVAVVVFTRRGRLPRFAQVLRGYREAATPVKHHRHEHFRH